MDQNLTELPPQKKSKKDNTITRNDKSASNKKRKHPPSRKGYLPTKGKGYLPSKGKGYLPSNGKGYLPSPPRKGYLPEKSSKGYLPLNNNPVAVNNQKSYLPNDSNKKGYLPLPSFDIPPPPSILETPVATIATNAGDTKPSKPSSNISDTTSLQLPNNYNNFQHLTVPGSKLITEIDNNNRDVVGGEQNLSNRINDDEDASAPSKTSQSQKKIGRDGHGNFGK